MIRSLNKALISLVALVGLAGNANAAFVSWESDYTGPDVLMGGTQGVKSFSFVHDIKPDGFVPFSNLVLDYVLTIDLYDDSSDGREEARINVPGSGGDKTVSSFSFNNNEYSEGWTFWGLVELNAAGTLSVIISAIEGDFYFGGSHLVANGIGSTKVPDPSTLALLGLGLLGVAAGVRRRA